MTTKRSKYLVITGTSIATLMVAIWFFRPSNTENERVFEAAWSFLDQHYYDAHMNGLDWVGVKRTYSLRARQAHSKADLYDNVLKPMVRLLESSHLEVLSPSEADSADPGPLLGIIEPAIGNCMGMVMDFRDAEISPKVLAVTSASPLNAIGVAKDWAILRYQSGSPTPGGQPAVLTFRDRAGQLHTFPMDKENALQPLDRLRLKEDTLWNFEGVAIDQARVRIDGLGITVRPGRTLKMPFIAAVWPGGQAYRAGIRAGQGFTSFTAARISKTDYLNIRMRLLDANGRSFKVQGKYWCPNEKARQVVTREFGTTLYIRFDRFDDAAVHQIRALVDRKPDTVVLDLQANGGGSSLALKQIAGMFLDQKALLGVGTSRSEREDLYPEKAEGVIPGAIYVLTSKSTRSSGEILAASLRMYRHAIIFGDLTAGAVVMSRNYKLPDGGVMQIPIADFVDAEGKRLERVGVMPDYPLSQAMNNPAIGALASYTKTL